RSIHRAGARAAGPFVAVSCAALGEDDLAAPVRETAGTSSFASVPAVVGGSLFLDEVAYTAPGVQAKLLRALEPDRDVAGGWPDVRVLSATNGDLAAEVEHGRFRRDLFYRLAGLTIRVPPLREHPEDIPLLSERLLAATAHRHGKRIRGIADDALAAL